MKLKSIVGSIGSVASLPITKELITNRHLLEWSIYTLQNTNQIKYNLTSTAQRITIIPKPKLISYSELGYRFNIDARTIRRCGDRAADSPMVIETTFGVALFPVDLFLSFYEWLEQFTTARRQTLFQVYADMFWSLMHDSLGRVTKTIRAIAMETKMDEKNCGDMIVDLVAGGWLVQYGNYNFTSETPHGYSYTLPEKLLKLAEETQKNLC